MDIKRLDESHATEYRFLRLNSLKNHPEAFGSSFEEEMLNSISFYKQRLMSDDSLTLGAFIDDRLVGMITLRYGNHKKTKHSGHIHAMYVDGDYQQQGIGFALVQGVIDEAKIRGVINLFLTVTSTNQKAIRLYEKCGFFIYGIEKRELYVNETYYDSLLMAQYL